MCAVYHMFQAYPSGLRYVYWEDGGKDAEKWEGHSKSLSLPTLAVIVTICDEYP